jgi:hypothetical protein
MCLFHLKFHVNSQKSYLLWAELQVRLSGSLTFRASVSGFSSILAQETHFRKKTWKLLTLIHTGVVSIALPNFEEVLLKKSLSKICLEKLCNPQLIS